MRILQIITLCGPGGAQAVVAHLANALQKQGHQVIVAAGEGNGQMMELIDPAIPTVRIPSLVRRLSPINEVKAMMAFRKLYRKYKPDIIHLHSSKAGMLGRMVFPKCKIVYTVHGFDSIRLAYRKFLPLERKMQSRCAAIVGVSRYDEQYMREEGIHENVTYVYNGIVDPAPLPSDPFERFKGYKHKILCIARISPQKYPELFVEVAKRMPDCAFLWIGNVDEPEFDYPDNAFFLGSILEAGSYCRYADAFLLTTHYEGLPIAIIEALASGVPVVASAVGGNPELLDGKNGFAVPNDPDVMVERLREILRPERREEMGRAARATFERDFTLQGMTEGYLKIYRRLYDINNRSGQ